MDTSQSAAVAELEQQLKDEAEVLSTLQQKAIQQLDMNNQRECTELEQKIEIRRTLLDKKVMLVATGLHKIPYFIEMHSG